MSIGDQIRDELRSHRTGGVPAQGHRQDGQMVAIAADAFNRLAVDIPTNALGRLSVAEPTPVAQIDAALGLRSRILEVFTAGSGVAEVEFGTTGREMHCASTSTIGSYGLIRTKRIAKYRPGQGVVFTFEGRFGTPVANSSMRIGAILSGTELSVGYLHDAASDNTNADLLFGLLHRSGGELHVERFTISAGTGGSPETITITLNGVAFPVSVTSGKSATEVARLLAAESYTGWIVWQNGVTVTFQATTLGVKGGAYGIASDGSAAGSSTTLNSGTAATDSWTTQADFSIDPLDGTGPSGMTLDPTKGNVFLCEFGHGSYGTITWFVKSDRTGMLVPFHRIAGMNTREQPLLSSPSIKVGLFAASLGTTTPVECWAASLASFIEGLTSSFQDPFGRRNNVAAIGTSLVPILSIRNRGEFNGGIINFSEVHLQSVSSAIEGTKPGEVVILMNATLTAPNWTYHSESNSVVEYDTSATGYTGGEEILGWSLAKSSSDARDVSGYQIHLDRLDTLTIAIRATSGTVDASVHLGWTED